MADPITFSGTEYRYGDLESMSPEDLLSLRNSVAGELGVAQINQFTDVAAAPKETWNALEKFNAKQEPAEEKRKKNAGQKTGASQGNPSQESKSAQPGVVKRPQRWQFGTIRKVGEHDGKTHGRAHRWPNYKDGMTIIDVIEGHGTEVWDVKNWISHGIMVVDEPSDEDYQKRRAEFFKRHGREDPEVVKAQEAEKREQRKAEQEKKRKEKAVEAKSEATSES